MYTQTRGLFGTNPVSGMPPDINKDRWWIKVLNIDFVIEIGAQVQSSKEMGKAKVVKQNV